MGLGRRPERGRGTVALVTACALLLIVGGSDVARGQGAASTAAVAGGSVATTTAAWRAAPAPTGLPHPGTPLLLTWTTSGGDALATFDVANVGDLALVDQWLRIRVDGDPDAVPTDPIVLTACVDGVWDATGMACPGTSVSLGSDRDGPVATGVPLAPGERLSVRATTRRRTAAQFRLLVDVEVRRTDVRAPTTTSG